MTNDEFRRAVLWVINNYGSPAGERQEPGSRAKAQAQRIAQILEEVNEVNEFIKSRQFGSVRAVPWSMEKE